MSINNSVGKHILIASDSEDELGDIHYLLADEFGNCLKASDETEG